MAEQPLLLEEFLLDTAAFAPFAGGEDNAVNWRTRRLISGGELRPDGRRFHSVLDAIGVATIRGLSDRVGLPLSPAAMTARILAGDLLARSPRDEHGHAIASIAAFPRDFAYVLAREDGKWAMNTVAINRRYVDYAGPWGRPHVVVPVAEIVADVVTQILEMNL